MLGPASLGGNGVANECLVPGSNMDRPVWYLYVLRCADGTLYTGVTTDRQRRCVEHNNGHGARYTAGRRPVKMIASWGFADRSSAQSAEVAFRRQSRAQKEGLISGKYPFLDSDFVDPQ